MHGMTGFGQVHGATKMSAMGGTEHNQQNVNAAVSEHPRDNNLMQI